MNPFPPQRLGIGGTRVSKEEQAVVYEINALTSAR